MRLVSEQSTADLRRHEAREALLWPLRELAANLLRIAKRGGRPVYLVRQMSDCLAALKEYADAHGALPSEQEIHDILDCGLAWEQHRPWIKERRADIAAAFGRVDNDSWSDREEAMKLIRKGALQVSASMLLDQLPQVSMGESDIHAGIRLLREAQLKARATHISNDETLAVLKKLKGHKTGKWDRKK
jgi:hypothetical protein